MNVCSLGLNTFNFHASCRTHHVCQHVPGFHRNLQLCCSNYLITWWNIVVRIGQTLPTFPPLPMLLHLSFSVLWLFFPLHCLLFPPFLSLLTHRLTIFLLSVSNICLPLCHHLIFLTFHKTFSPCLSLSRAVSLCHHHYRVDYLSLWLIRGLSAWRQAGGGWVEEVGEKESVGGCLSTDPPPTHAHAPHPCWTHPLRGLWLCCVCGPDISVRDSRKRERLALHLLSEWLCVFDPAFYFIIFYYFIALL